MNPHLTLVIRTFFSWLLTLVLVFPLIWLLLTAFKTELQAIAVPPELFFTPTTENFTEVNVRSDYWLYARNSGFRWSMRASTALVTSTGEACRLR